MSADDAAPMEGNACTYCNGTIAVPTIFGEYEGCPSCVLDGGDTFVVLDTYTVPDDEDEKVQVFCARCPRDQATWISTYREVPSSVEGHVREHHLGAPGPSRPDGTVIWVEGEDWMLASDHDLDVMFGFLDDPHP